MLEQIKTYWLFGKQYTSIEISSRNEVDVFFGVTAAKRKGEFTDIVSFESDSLDGLMDSVSKGSHGFLSITTSQVLIKETPLRENGLDMIKEAFPGLKNDEFYFEILQTSKKAFVSVCRKEYVNELLNQFKRAKIHILGFGLGFGKLQEIIELIDVEQILVSRFLMRQQAGEISAYADAQSLKNKTYQIADITVDSSHLLSLAGLANYQETSRYISNTKEKNSSLHRHFKETAFFKKGLIVAASLLLGTLTLNAILFTNYHNQLSTLQEESKIIAAQKERFAFKQNEIAKKERIVKNITLSGSSKSTFYINRITNSLPKSISLSLLEFQPVQKSVRPDKPIELERGKITIEGESLDKVEFSKWISELSTLEWVDTISTSSYNEQNKSAEFGISIAFVNESEE